MQPRQFSKPPLSIEDQIALLQKRGMHFEDLQNAKQTLAHINYFRLRAYWLPFEEIKTTNTEHRFKARTNFQAVLDIYEFDRKLRLLLLDAIERLEVSLRCRWASVLAMRYGAFAHLEPSIFTNAQKLENCKNDLIKEYRRSHETFAKHYQQQYANFPTPPIWVSCEMVTIGQLSHWFQNIKKPSDRQEITLTYHLDEKILVSFLHHISTIRNHCAHHSRVWNRQFTIKTRLPEKKPQALKPVFNVQALGLIYNTLVLLVFALSHMKTTTSWKKQLLAFLDEHPNINLAAMGFPDGWRNMPFWSR